MGASRRSWNCSRPLAGASSHIALASGASLPVVRTLVARSRESCVACGQTSRRTHVATTVGSRIPARSVVVLSTLPTLPGGVQENKRGCQRRLHRTATCLLLFAAFASLFDKLA